MLPTAWALRLLLRPLGQARGMERVAAIRGGEVGRTDVLQADRALDVGDLGVRAFQVREEVAALPRRLVLREQNDDGVVGVVVGEVRPNNAALVDDLQRVRPLLHEILNDIKVVPH